MVCEHLPELTWELVGVVDTLGDRRKVLAREGKRCVVDDLGFGGGCGDSHWCSVPVLMATGTVEQLRECLRAVEAGGGERAVERHRSRGKLTASDRIAGLIDEGTEPLWLSTLAAWGMYSGDIARAGVLSCIGLVHGQPCVIVANDATVKGGTYYPVSVAKHLRAQLIAIANALPCIYLVDSGGAHLPLQSETFADRDHGGRMFFNQARMSAAGIPQVSLVMGSCTAGGAYMPAMSDETIIVEGTGTVFLGGPPLVYAATGEIVTAEELGGAAVHTRISGLTDHMVPSDAAALELAREIVDHALPRRGERSARSDVTLAPELDEISDRIAAGEPADVDRIVGALMDGDLHEFKGEYGVAVRCGFGTIGGQEVALIGVRGRPDAPAARKTTHLLQIARQRNLPALFVHDVPEGEVDRDPARARALAALTATVATHAPGVLTLVVGRMAWPDSYSLGARAMQPRFLFTWPCARIGEQTALEATAHVRDDGILVPSETRSALAAALTAIASPVAKTTPPGRPVLRL
jgi:3-methylcrotonyl-CoA carboxylase beta subunit